MIIKSNTLQLLKLINCKYSLLKYYKSNLIYHFHLILYHYHYHYLKIQVHLFHQICIFHFEYLYHLSCYQL